MNQLMFLLANGIFLALMLIVLIFISSSRNDSGCKSSAGEDIRKIKEQINKD